MAKKSYIALTVNGSASYDLPASMCREIGRIVVGWAYLENCIQEMNWQMLGLAPAPGRIAVREPRAEDRLEMLHELLKLHGAEWDHALYKSILKRTRLLKAKRDLVAHGLWHHNQRDGWCVQLTRGSWPKELAELVSGSRKVMPESVPLDADQLRDATNEIGGLIDDLKKLRVSAVGPPLPSPGTRP